MNKPTSRISALNASVRALKTFLCICFGVVIISGTASAQWQGKEVTEDGVLHVKNPAAALSGDLEIVLEERWRLGGETDDEDEFFGVLSQIEIGEDKNVYLLDIQLHEVKIFSPEGRFVRTIGREGEGPGEFRRPTGMLMLPGGSVGIIQSRPGKIILLTPQGDPAGEYPVPEAEGGGIQFFSTGRRSGDQIALGTQSFSRRADGADINFKLIRVDRTGVQTALYLERNETRSMANFVVDEKESGGFGMMWDVSPDGRLFVSAVFDAYRIDVYRPGGGYDRIIERAYEPRQRTGEEMDRVRNRIPVRMGRGGRRFEPEIKISKTDRDISGMFPRDDGSLWVLSSRGSIDAPEGVIATFDVFDTEGRFARQVTLKGEGSYPPDGLFFAGNRLYVVTDLQSARAAMYGGSGEGSYDDEEEEDLEPMSVICYDLGFQLHGMNR